MKKMKLFPLAVLFAASALTFTFTSCDEDNDDEDNNASGYKASDDVASANLVAKFSFENNVDDTKGNITGGTSSGTSFIAGAKGQAWKGASNGYVLYTGVSSAISGLNSLTVASWIKTKNHMDGGRAAQAVIGILGAIITAGIESEAQKKGAGVGKRNPKIPQKKPPRPKTQDPKTQAQKKR